MIRLELGSGEMTRAYSINPRRSWMRGVAKLRALFSKGPFEVHVRGGEDSWLYLHLVKQEIGMWSRCPETFDQEDFDIIVERRGFTVEEAQSILDCLRWLGYRFRVTVKPEVCKVLTAGESI